MSRADQLAELEALLAEAESDVAAQESVMYDYSRKQAGFDGGYSPTGSSFETIAAQARRATLDFMSNVRQVFAEATGDEVGALKEQIAQAERAALFGPAERDRPASAFVGQTLPYMLVPGGKVAQGVAGAVEGGLQGDTLGQRAIGAATGLTAGVGGAKIGDEVLMRLQNRAQRGLGRVDANARRELISQGVPLSLSQRTDGPISKPLARFFERGRFVWTGRAPKGAQQQKKLSEIITDALGIKGTRLTREILGGAVEQNRTVFQTAANRVGRIVRPDDELRKAASSVETAFNSVGSDSAQVNRVFDNYLDYVTSPDGIPPEKLLQLRSNLSEATTKTDIETSAIVDAISSIDDQLIRLNPDLADDLMIARDRFRLLLAIRRGAALSPQGEINIPTLTKNLERVFRDFDAGKPLPRSLRDAGEAVGSFNQVAMPFRSSGTAENEAVLALGALGTVEPSNALRIAAGLSAPFAGGGTGAQVGGAVGRSGAFSMRSPYFFPEEDE
jgi:hypothetical protein